MIESVRIESLRGIKSGGLDGLSAVSILVGPNNSGKSTFLEAVEVVGHGVDGTKVEQCLRRRGGPKSTQLHHAIRDGAQSVAVETSPSPRRASVFGTDYQPALTRFVQERLTSWNVHPNVLPGGGRAFYPGNEVAGFPVRHVDVLVVRSENALEDAYTEIDRAGRLKAVVAALRASMPTLEDLRILKEGDDYVLHTFTSDGARVPSYLAGDGFKRLLELASVLADLPNGVALLEEPECYQHPRYMRELVALIQHAVASKTQIILSTHSLELVDALLGADWPAEATYPTVHRVRLTDGVFSGTALSREQARVAREELVEDLRA